MLTIGKPAPSFTARTYFPETDEARDLSLAELRGKWVVLVFYPSDFTFVCPTELAELADLHAEVRALNGEIVGVSTDSVYTHRTWLQTEKLLANVRFPLAADTTGNCSRAYGAHEVETGLAMRGTFLIDPDGVLRAMMMTDDKVGRSARETMRLLQAAAFARENPNVSCPASWERGRVTVKPHIRSAGKAYEQVTVAPAP